MTESEILTLNERVKTASAYSANLSAALVAVATGRIWAKAGFDLAVALWLLVAAGLLLISWQLLHLLEAVEAAE